MKIRFPEWLLSASFVALKVNGSPSNGTAEDQLKSDKIIPAPLVIPASQYFDGDDGAWSSLALRVGNPAQDVRVLVSTNSPQTLVVLPLGCTSAAISPVPSGCANSRGGLFNNSLSNTWEDIGLFGVNGNGVGFQADLGYSQTADFGQDSIGLGYVSGTNGPVLDNQTIGAIATASPFYTNIRAWYSTSELYDHRKLFGFFLLLIFMVSKTYSKSHLELYGWSEISAQSWSIFAIDFWGYDTSRFTPNSASFTLSLDVNRDIVVAIQSITYSGTTQASLLASPTYAFIESTDPNFWLPELACQEFEKAFGLSLDNTTGLYLINSTQYSLLTATNPQVTFKLADALTGGDTVSIVLPFNAFALPASYPFVPNDTYYFPLRKSDNDSQNTLGRAFLQEAYLTVDYERGNFTVSQCTWIDGTSSEIKTIISPTLTTSNSSFTPQASPSDSSSNPMQRLSIGVICVIVVSLVVVIAIAEIALREMEGNLPKDGSRMTPSPNPPSNYYAHDMKVPMVEAPGHESRDPVELQSSDLNNHLYFTRLTNKPTELYTNTSENPYEDHTTATWRMDYQRKFAMASEMDASPTMFELPGGNPLVEMDDERSRPRLAKSSVSQQSYFQDGHPLSEHSSSSPALFPAISGQSPSLRVSSKQERISPFAGFTRQSSSVLNSNNIDRKSYSSPNSQPTIESLRRSGTGGSGNSEISVIAEESTGTPLSMTSPTLGRPPSIFLRTSSRSGEPV